MRTVSFFAFIIGMLFSHIVSATSLSCTPANVKIQNKNIILGGVVGSHASQIYFLHNISKKSLWIDHPTDLNRSLKAGWSSFLRPGNWSALLLNRKDFSINCATIDPGKVNYQDCSKSLSVCVPKDVKFDSKRKGSFWLVEDKSYEDLIATLEKRGAFIPKSVDNPKQLKEGKKKANDVNQKQKSDKKSNPKKHEKKHLVLGLFPLPTLS